MNKAVLFKALQRRNRYRNPENILDLTKESFFSRDELYQSEKYLSHLVNQGIKYTYPGDEFYPDLFYKMIEPPLFLEFKGRPVWKNTKMLSVVGSRNCHDLTTQWLNTQLLRFLKIEDICLVSGGARGVDLKSHLVSLRAEKPTVAVLPCGLSEVYPFEFKSIVDDVIAGGGAVMSEFEMYQKIHKSFFYFRNRLIASLGKVCLVAQAGLKSGTLLTVHHALQNGRPVITIPSHPSLSEFAGNIKLINDGAVGVTDCVSLYDFWKAESWSGF